MKSTNKQVLSSGCKKPSVNVGWLLERDQIKCHHELEKFRVVSDSEKEFKIKCLDCDDIIHKINEQTEKNLLKDDLQKFREQLLEKNLLKNDLQKKIMILGKISEMLDNIEDEIIRIVLKFTNTYDTKIDILRILYQNESQKYISGVGRQTRLNPARFRNHVVQLEDEDLIEIEERLEKNCRRVLLSLSQKGRGFYSRVRNIQDI